MRKKHIVREYSGGTSEVSFGTSQAHTRNPDKIREYLEHLPFIISSIMHRHPPRISAYIYKTKRCPHGKIASRTQIKLFSVK
jgi:hypothetical protein